VITEQSLARAYTAMKVPCNAVARALLSCAVGNDYIANVRGVGLRTVLEALRAAGVFAALTSASCTLLDVVRRCNTASLPPPTIL
jgi:hypothetical protein